MNAAYITQYITCYPAKRGLCMLISGLSNQQTVTSCFKSTCTLIKSSSKQPTFISSVKCSKQSQQVSKSKYCYFCCWQVIMHGRGRGVAGQMGRGRLMPNKQNLRVVECKPQPCIVSVEGLSSSTTDVQLKNLLMSVGPIQVGQPWFIIFVPKGFHSGKLI